MGQHVTCRVPCVWRAGLCIDMPTTCSVWHSRITNGSSRSCSTSTASSTLSQPSWASGAPVPQHSHSPRGPLVLLCLNTLTALVGLWCSHSLLPFLVSCPLLPAIAILGNRSCIPVCSAPSCTPPQHICGRIFSLRPVIAAAQCGVPRNVLDREKAASPLFWDRVFVHPSTSHSQAMHHRAM